MSKEKGFLLHSRRIVVLFLFLIPDCSLFANESDISGTLFNHVLNSNELVLFPFLSPIHLPSGMTVHHLMLFLSVLVIVLILLSVARKNVSRPGKMLSAVEMVLIFIRDDMVYPVMGKEKGKKWMPFFVSLFFFLLVINLVGLLPAFKTATGNINVTTAMAIIVLLLTFISGFKEIGPVKFFKNLLFLTLY